MNFHVYFHTAVLCKFRPTYETLIFPLSSMNELMDTWISFLVIFCNTGQVFKTNEPLPIKKFSDLFLLKSWEKCRSVFLYCSQRYVSSQWTYCRFLTTVRFLFLPAWTPDVSEERDYLRYTSRLMTKPTKWHVRPAKTQISLGIRTVSLRVFAVRLMGS